MDQLGDRYSKKELEELRKILNSKYGEEYISRAFDEFEMKESHHLSSKDKMKLLEKQKKGKKRRGEHAKMDIPQEVFMKMVQDSER